VASEAFPEVRVDDGAGLRVDAAGDDRLGLLARFDFIEPAMAVRSTGLACLGGSVASECWRVAEPVQSGREGRVDWWQAGNVLFLACLQADDGTVDAAELTESGYRELLGVAEARGCPRLLRAWNFLPSINRGEGDAERYRRFCLGRGHALEAHGLADSDLCAGTAIGGDDPHLRVFVLAGTRPGLHIENPRQVSAYRYPRVYGPRSPSFARATALPRDDGSMLLMVSGTASVVGHRTLHAGDLDGQIDEIVVNLNALLAESVMRLGRPALGQFGPHSLLRVYVRRAEDWPRVAERLERAWPDTPLVGLRGDVCRSDLLVEIEAVTAG
jgi:chorismate lyase/3-hydroxybenzoate synthase